MGHQASRERPVAQGPHAFTGVLPSTGDSSASGVPPRARRASPLPAATSPSTTAVPTLTPPRHALLQTPDAPLETSRRASEIMAVPESVRRSLAMDEHADLCSEILPGLLFVSNLSVAQDIRRLEALGITHVVNCCREITCELPSSRNEHTTIKLLALALRDGVQEDLLPFLYIAVDFIEGARRQRDERGHGAVLVHCHQGVSRSCAVAIAYVMYHTTMSFQEASAFVKARRAISSPNAAFLCQLIEWERDLAASHSAWNRLYRLAPHAAYDAETFVLKTCYEDPSSRQPVRLEASGDPRPWLWPGGVFVFVNEQREIVVWRGHQCPSRPELSLDSVKEHISRMLRVLLRLPACATEAPAVVEITSSSTAENASDYDRFGYAEELSWLTHEHPARGSIKSAFETARTELRPGEATDKSTRVFVLAVEGDEASDAAVEWEPLTEYDSDDLTAGDAFLVVSWQDEAFLWLGRDCTVDVSRLAHWGERQLSAIAGPAVSCQLVRQHHETDAFWEAFEAGY
ncbi:hypothetical protein P43SY_007057 [Pythium insidiosum]|uniref:Dual specificity protein phosphatase n=1 Tax=Pythium insidiosum TaxID=114742 RepID=A0AAD5QBF1_PYTIN|nr:hypothetical protein P43SY_007057 [Pythium insidiosum]